MSPRFFLSRRFLALVAAAIFTIGLPALVIGFSADPITALSSLSTLATAVCTAVLGWFTYVLARGNHRAAEQANRLSREAMHPLLIIYTDLDEGSRHANIILENTTRNPAFDVSIRFDPDPQLNPMAAADTDWERSLSDYFRGTYPTIAPHQRITRTFGLFTDLTGSVGPIPEFEATAHLKYTAADGTIINRSMSINTAATNKSWWEDDGAEYNRNKTIKKSGELLAKTISDAARAITSRSPDRRG